MDGASFGRKRRDPASNIDCTEHGAKLLASLGPMPEPRRLTLSLLPAQVSGNGRSHFAPFMRHLGAAGEESVELEVVDGYALNVSREIFTDHKTGTTKIDKEGRQRYLLYLAETVLRPDEVWLGEGGHGDKTLYHLARFLVGENLVGLIAVFKQTGRLWEGWSGYQSTSEAYFLSKRTGRRIFP